MYSEKENREYYIRIGRCPRCGGKNPLAPGMHTCRECADKSSAGWRERRKYRRENGLCTRCGKPLPDGSKYVTCDKCREYIRPFKAFNKARYEGLKLQGKCVKCAKRWAEPGKTMCKQCIADWHRSATLNNDTYQENKRKRRQELREAGLCIDCGQVVDGDNHTRCKRCRDMRMDSTRKYRIRKRLEKEAEDVRKNQVSKLHRPSAGA